MKNIHILLVVLLSLVLFTGAAKEDVSKGLSAFERSLTEWMRSIETLASKIDTLEEKVNESAGATPELISALTEIADSVGDMRKSMSRYNTRLSRIEESLGGAAGENPMVEFGRTLNILKKNLSQLNKKLSDQAALTAVLEGKYADFMRPLDPIKKTLGEVDETLNTLKEGDSEQDEKIGALETLLADRLSILEDFLSVSERQTQTLDVLAKRVANLEDDAGIIPSEELYTEAEAEEVAEAVAEEEARPKTPEEEGYEGIGDGFYVRDVEFKRFGSSAKVTGEIKNLSDDDYRIVVFNIMVYNLDNILVSDRDFSIKGLGRDVVKKFNEALTGTDPGDISKYVISFKSTTQF